MKKDIGARGPAEGTDGTGVDFNEVARGTKNFIERMLGDVSKTTASKQIVLGGAAGLCTGFISMRVGKAAATAVGGGVLLLAIANHKGYIKIDWDKFLRHVDKVTDKVEKAATGEGPSTMDKMERYLNRKLDKAEASIKGQEKKAKRWFSSSEDGFQLSELHIFLGSFAAGLAIGVITG